MVPGGSNGSPIRESYIKNTGSAIILQGKMSGHQQFSSGHRKESPPKQAHASVISTSIGFDYAQSTVSGTTNEVGVGVGGITSPQYASPSNANIGGNN